MTEMYKENKSWLSIWECASGEAGWTEAPKGHPDSPLSMMTVRDMLALYTAQLSSRTGSDGPRQKAMIDTQITGNLHRLWPAGLSPGG